jgi:hypothetical protein
MKLLKDFKDMAFRTLSKIELETTPNLRHTVIGIVIFFVVCFWIYVLAWLYLFMTESGDERMKISLIQEWRSFLTLLVSGSTIAAGVTMLKVIFVDKDNDNIPDILEEDESSRRIMPPVPPNNKI